MAKRYQKFGGIVLSSAALVGLVAGCGSSGGSNTGNSGSGQSGSGPVQISFWYGLSGTDGNLIQQMVSKFNSSQTAVHVTATFQGSYSGGGPEQQKLLAALKAGNPPTIAQIEVHSMPLFASTGRLMDLTSFVNSSKVDKPSNFLQGMMASTQYQGKYYAVPFNRSVPVFFYNETMFKQAGITNPPTTWAEVAADAQKLTHGSGKSKVYGFEPLVDWWPWEYSVWSGGGSILNSSNTKATFATPAATRILTDWQNMVKSGDATVETGPNYWELMTEDFIHGRTAMDIDSIGDAGEVVSGVGNKFEWGTTLLPRDQTLAVPPGGGDIAIMNGASQAQVQAAEKFIEWWTSPSQAAKWAEVTGYMPVVQSAVNLSSYQAYLKKYPQYKTALNELQYQKAAPASASYLSVVQTVQQALQGVLDEGKPVQSTMQTAENEANSNLG